ncbi:HIT domain-containing protein [Candidatus Gottesmanbacteria bacterium]|nr:HIT domain-containing protein [Candidatus Gottesmanbacteria bacterium]
MDECIFCKIVLGQLPAKFVYQDDDIIAIKDIHPKAPIHLLVMPRKHRESLKDIKREDQEVLGKLLLVVQKVAADAKIAEDGYKVFINSGHDAGQIVFHLHLHVLGGWKKAPRWDV